MTTIHDKIQKLLALSSSPNDNEAATALKLAQKLMLEHGVTEDQLNPTQSATVGETDAQEYKSQFQVVAACAAAALYGCKVVTVKYPFTGLKFVGRADNRRIAETTWSFFLLQVEHWYKNELPKGMTQRERSKYRKEYKLSMAEELNRRCVDYRPPSSSTALVLHKDQLAEEIMDYFKDTGVRVKKSRQRKVTHLGAHLRGTAAAKAADIHRGVKG